MSHSAVIHRLPPYTDGEGLSLKTMHHTHPDTQQFSSHTSIPTVYIDHRSHHSNHHCRFRCVMRRLHRGYSGLGEDGEVMSRSSCCCSIVVVVAVVG